MKHALVLAAAVVATSFISCKKDRTCACSSQVISGTSNDPNYTYKQTPPSTTTIKYSKIKKNNIVLKKCVSEEYTNNYNYSSNYQITEVKKSTCTIK